MKFEIIKKYSNDNLELPVRGTSGSAGYDFAAAEDMVIEPYSKDNKVFLVPTGIKAKFPKDVVLHIFERSSLGSKKKVSISNKVGVIDSDYYNNDKNEGHIMLPLRNDTDKPINISKGEKLAQGIFSPVLFVEDDEATETRKGGFGSTGQ